MCKIKELTLNNKELQKQTEDQINFLKTVFPDLIQDGYAKCCIEIRPIVRKKGMKYSKGINLWKLDDKGIERLIKFNEDINGKATCVYYSTFALDYSIEVPGKIKGMINNQNAQYTTILPIDFDNMSMSEFVQEKSKLAKLGIETLDIMTGHGFQSIVLLDKKIYDKNILKKWTTLLISKGIKADSALIDPARVLRMPYTNNCKEFDENNKYYSEDPQAIPTTDICWTEKRYDLIDIFKRIQSLEDVLPMLEEEQKYIEELTNVKQEVITKSNNTKGSGKRCKEVLSVIKNTKSISDIDEVEKLYGDIINIHAIPDAIINILYRTPEGIRNATLLFLLPYLKNSLNLCIEDMTKVLTIWGSRCSPALSQDFIINEVKRLMKYHNDSNKYKYGSYTEEMKSEFGPLEINEFAKNNNIIIYNDILESLHIISDKALRIYLSLELHDNNEKKGYSINEITKIANTSIATINRHLPILIRQGYIRKIKGYKRGKEKYTYSISPYRSGRRGYTIFNKATLKLMLMELTDPEITLYSYLNRMLNKEKKVTASQQYLGGKIGKSQNRVCELTTNLHEKQYLQKTTFKIGDLLHCRYTIEY